MELDWLTSLDSRWKDSEGNAVLGDLRDGGGDERCAREKGLELHLVDCGVGVVVGGMGVIRRLLEINTSGKSGRQVCTASTRSKTNVVSVTERDEEGKEENRGEGEDEKGGQQSTSAQMENWEQGLGGRFDYRRI